MTGNFFTVFTAVDATTHTHLVASGSGRRVPLEGEIRVVRVHRFTHRLFRSLALQLEGGSSCPGHEKDKHHRHPAAAVLSRRGRVCRTRKRLHAADIHFKARADIFPCARPKTEINQSREGQGKWSRRGKSHNCICRNCECALTSSPRCPGRGRRQSPHLRLLARTTP